MINKILAFFWPLDKFLIGAGVGIGVVFGALILGFSFPGAAG